MFPSCYVCFFLLTKYRQLLWFTIGYIAYILIITVASFYFPTIDADRLSVKNAILRFRVSFHFNDIESVQIFFGAYRNLALKIKLKGKRRIRFCPICAMGFKSIRPFVEELRSKGVKVECEPYEHDGEMIYL